MAKHIIGLKRVGLWVIAMLLVGVYVLLYGETYYRSETRWFVGDCDAACRCIRARLATPV